MKRWIHFAFSNIEIHQLLEYAEKNIHHIIYIGNYVLSDQLLLANEKNANYGWVRQCQCDVIIHIVNIKSL